MSPIDIQEVVKFLGDTPPFDNLGSKQLQRIVAELDVIYVRKGEQPTPSDANSDAQDSLPAHLTGLFIIRRGAFEITGEDGTLVDKIADGECFGLFSILESSANIFKVTALEDSLVFRLPKERYKELTESNPDFAEFFATTRVKRLDRWSISKQHLTNKQPSIATVAPATTLTAPATTETAPAAPNTEPKTTEASSAPNQIFPAPSQDSQAHHPADNRALSLPITELMSPKIISATPATSILEASQKMTEARVSSLLVVENEKLVGIVTDRDLRSRVLAQGLAADHPVSRIMTKGPICMEDSSLSIHGQLLMSEKNIHHLPVVDQHDRPLGMVTVTDMLKDQQVSPLLMVSDIHRKQSVEELSTVLDRLPKLTINLILAEINPVDMGEVLATITDNLTRRLIKLAQEKLGEPPMPFNFLVFGSQARKDQSLGSDQDNALMLERAPSEEEKKYFRDLAQFVCDGLNACGVPYCPGNIMSTNEDLCLTTDQWHRKFSHWISDGSPQSLLNASIFFDIRCLYGSLEPVHSLTELVQEKASSHSIFLATLTRNAISTRPPLGFFRDFVVEQSGDHKNELDLKHQALAPINDLARIYGFSTTDYKNNTMDRLQCIETEGLLSADSARNLQDAWEYLSELRLYAQQESWQKHGTPSAYLDPSSLSPLQRKHLKHTFKTIIEVQSFAQNTFAKGMG